MGWLGKLFGRGTGKGAPVGEPPVAPVGAGTTPPNLDPRMVPMDNPLDYREDGSIRPGDPMYDILMASLASGEPMAGNQRPDGTWEFSGAGDVTGDSADAGEPETH